MSGSSDVTRVAVVGGGHNGLVAAVLLARAGCDVTVLEQAAEVGGCLWTQRTTSGVVIERGAIDHGGMRAIAGELGLERFGLTWRERELLSAFRVDGEDRLFTADAAQTADGLGADRDRYLALVARARMLFDAVDMFAQPPTPTSLAAMLSSLRGGDDLFRTVLMSAERVIADGLDDPRTRAALGLYAAHSQLPPWAPGSGAMGLLLPAGHGEPGVRPVGGSRALADALRAALEAAGGRVRVGAPVTAVTQSRDGVRVDTSDGEGVVVDRVVSSLDLVRTAALLDRVPDAMAASARTLVSGSFNVAEMTLSIARPGEGPRLPGGDQALTFVQTGLDDLRRGFGDIMAGRAPRRPWAMVTGVDQDGGPGSATWISTVVPLRRASGAWTERAEERAAQSVIETVSAQLDVDLTGEGAEVTVTGPRTWIQRIGGTGNPNHIDLTLDQMFGWRPPGAAGHRTEVPWLYLTGAGTPPGGGLSGVSGRAAATALLHDLDARPSAGARLRSAAREAGGLWSAMRTYLQMRRGA